MANLGNQPRRFYDVRWLELLYGFCTPHQRKPAAVDSILAVRRVSPLENISPQLYELPLTTLVVGQAYWLQ